MDGGGGYGNIFEMRGGAGGGGDGAGLEIRSNIPFTNYANAEFE